MGGTTQQKTKTLLKLSSQTCAASVPCLCHRWFRFDAPGRLNDYWSRAQSVRVISNRAHSCFFNEIACDGNRLILLKNSEAPVRLGLAEKLTTKIAPGSTISNACRGVAPPKILLKAEVGSFSTELVGSSQS